MAKIVKDTRETIDVEKELTEIKSKKKDSKNKKEKEADKKKNTKKDTKKKSVKKVKKQSGIIKFFKEVKSEVSKVKWPSKKDMVKYSLATIIFVVFFALFFYGIDAAIALLKKLKEVI